MVTHQIFLDAPEPQTGVTLSHAGGCPVLPPEVELPHCAFCQAPMTFFFQTVFPEPHPWHGRVLAFFQCTHCFSEDHSVPQAFYGKGITVPDGHLDRFQKNFRVLVFGEDQGVQLRDDHPPTLEHQRITFEKTRRKTRTPRIGGDPAWFMGDETPLSYQGSPFTFLLQTGEDWTFHSLPDRPRQRTSLGFRRDDRYLMFSGLPLFFYGCLVDGEPKVYLFNQK